MSIVDFVDCANCIPVPYEVKKQCLQMYNIVETSINRQISGQFTTVVKGCMYIMFNVVDTGFFFYRNLSR